MSCLDGEVKPRRDGSSTAYPPPPRLLIAVVAAIVAMAGSALVCSCGPEGGGNDAEIVAQEDSGPNTGGGSDADVLKGGRVLLPPYLPRIATRDRIERATGEPMHTFVLVANLAGEVEACNCASSSRRGGILATAAFLERLSRTYDNLIILDAGGNRDRRDGTLAADQLPADFLDLLDRIFALDFPRDGSAGVPPASDENVSATQGGGSPTLISALDATTILTAIGVAEEDLPPRGIAVILASATTEALASYTAAESETDGDGETAPLRDVTRDVQLDFLKVSIEDDFESQMDTLLTEGFVVDQLLIPGDLWREDAWLFNYRQRMLEDWATMILASRLPVLLVGDEPLADDAEPGAECRSCHEREYQSWRRNGPHARAWETLTHAENDAHRNAFCVPCHTTGLTVDALVRDPGKPPGVFPRQQSVSCQSCHTRQPNTHSACAKAYSTVESACDSCHGSSRGTPDTGQLGCRTTD